MGRKENKRFHVLGCFGHPFEAERAEHGDIKFARAHVARSFHKETVVKLCQLDPPNGKFFF